MPDTFLAGESSEFLSIRHAKPFFLWVGFYVTHSPFRFPVEFAGRFDPATFPVPEVAPEDIERIPFDDAKT